MTRPDNELAASAGQPCRKGRYRARISAFEEVYREIPAKVGFVVKYRRV